jgi:hypothetical protein
LKGAGFSPYIKLKRMKMGLTGCEKTLWGKHEVSGHDFSRADQGFLLNLRLQPLSEPLHLHSTFSPLLQSKGMGFS